MRAPLDDRDAERREQSGQLQAMRQDPRLSELQPAQGDDTQREAGAATGESLRLEGLRETAKGEVYASPYLFRQMQARLEQASPATGTLDSGQC